MSIPFKMASRLSRYLVRRIDADELRCIAEGGKMSDKLTKQVAIGMEVVWTELFDVGMADTVYDRRLWKSAFVIFRAHAKMGHESMEEDRI